MPFKVKKSGEGYKVFSPKGAKSKKPMSKEKALAQQKAIYANWDGKENTSRENKMKITKKEANKLLESIKVLEGMWVPGDEWDDEGNRRDPRTGRGYDGGGYRRRYSAYRAPAPTAPTIPATQGGADDKAIRIATAIAKKKGLASPDQGLIDWVKKQIASGKFAEEKNIFESKEELLETAGKLLKEAKIIITKKKIEEGMSDKDVNTFMSRLAPSDDSVAITDFIKKFKREPLTTNDDWHEVSNLLPSTGMMTADSDFRHKIWRAKGAIIAYWKNKRLAAKEKEETTNEGL
jgi:hypothetical protein